MDDTWRQAVTATRHCLTGCAIGEVLGMVVATAAGWGNLASIAISVVLAFFFGYLLTFTGVRRAGLPVADAVRIDLAAGLITRWGQPVRLTRTEYRLLELLASNAGRLCSTRFLLECLWGPGSDHKGRHLQDHMASLRRKLDDPSAPELLVTEPGMGYRLVLPT